MRAPQGTRYLPGQGGVVADPDFFAAMAPQESFYGFKLAGEFATERNGKTYITFQGPKYDAYCAAVNFSTGKREGPYYLRPTGLISDSHGVPAHVFPNSGKLLVFSGCHNSPLLVTQMTNVEDAKSWTNLGNAAPLVTYPRVFLLSDGTIFLIYRAGEHIDDIVFNTSTDEGVTWSAATHVLSGGATVGNLQDSWYFGAEQSGDNIHFTFLWKDDTNGLSAPDPEFIHRYNVYYLKIAGLTGAATKADGTSVTLPVTKTFANANLRLVDTQTSLDFVQIASPAANATGQPAILFLRGKDKSHTYYFLKWNGSSFDSRTLPVTTDHVFDDYYLEFVTGTTWRAYLTTGGSSGNFGDYDDLLRDRAGNLEKWTTTDDGVSWTKEATVAAVSVTGVAPFFSGARAVKNGRTTANVIYQTYPTALDDFTSKLYLSGSGGRITFPREDSVKQFLARATALSTAQQSMAECIINALTDLGVWAKMAEYWECRMPDATTARLGWKGRYDLLPRGNSAAGPAFTAYAGFKDGTADSYHTTTLVPSLDGILLRDSGHLSIWANENIQNAANIAGWTDGTSITSLTLRNSSNQMTGRWTQASALGSSVGSVLDSSRMSVINRSASNAIQLYKNNTGTITGGTGSNVSVALSATAVLDIGRAGAVTPGTTRIGGADIGSSLTAADVAVLYLYRYAWGRMVGEV